MSMVRGHTVDRVAGNAAEDAPRLINRIVNDRQTWCCQNQRRGTSSRISRAGDSRSAVGLLQRRRVIDAVAGHRYQVPTVLQRLDDGIFMLREHTRKPVRLDDRIRDGLRYMIRIHVLGKGLGCRNDLVAQSELAGRFPSNSGIVAGDHLDRHALGSHAFDGLLGIVAWWVEHRQDAQQRPRSCPRPLIAPRRAPRYPRDPKSATEASTLSATPLSALARATMACGAPLATVTVLPDASVAVAWVRFDTGSKGNEFADGVSLERSRILERGHDRGVNHVSTVLLGRQSRRQDHILWIGRTEEDRIAQCQLVFGQRAGFVGAQNIDPGPFPRSTPTAIQWPSPSKAPGLRAPW